MGPPPPPVPVFEPPQKGPRRAWVRYPAQAGALAIGYRMPAASDPTVPTLDVIQYALSAGEGAVMIRDLVYDKGLAVNVMVDASWRLDPGAFSVYAELRPGVKPEKVEKIIDEILERVASGKLAATDVLRAKNLLRARSLRELATRNGKAHALGTAELLLGSWKEALGVIDRYQAVTPGQVKSVARDTFDPNRKCTVVLDPAAD